MEENQKRFTRGDVLAKLALAPLAIGAFAALQQSEAEADTKSAKSAVQYVDKSANGKLCSQCQFYIAGKSKTAKGKCKIVAGDIAPGGYCVAWAAKS